MTAALLSFSLIAAACGGSEDSAVEAGVDAPNDELSMVDELPGVPGSDGGDDTIPKDTGGTVETGTDGGSNDGAASAGDSADFVLDLGDDADNGTNEAGGNDGATDGGVEDGGADNITIDFSDLTPPTDGGPQQPTNPAVSIPPAPSSAPASGGQLGPVNYNISRWSYIGVLGNLGPNEQVTAPAASPPQVAAGISPLTGLPATESLDRPALVVKIDNSGLARPQASINQADIVYEELVESGITRLAAVYHSTSVSSIGPVRSGRSTDIGIISSFNNPLFAFSGANSIYEVLIDQSPSQNRSHEIWGGYWRQSSRPAPHNLFTNTETLWASGGGGAPAAHFAFRSDGQPATAGIPASEIRIDFLTGISQTVQYGWDASIGGWRRWQGGSAHFDAAGDQVAPENVIVQYVNYIDSGLTDKWGEDLYEGVSVGTGQAMVFTDGRMIQATWTRPTLTSVTTYTDSAGNNIALTPGNTWVALVPPSGASYA